MQRGERRAAVPRHRPEPPDRHRVDDGHELRQAGAPPARVPRACSARCRAASRCRSTARTTGSTPAVAVHGLVAVPDRRRRARPADAARSTAELADGTLTWCTGPKTLAEHTDPDDQRRPPTRPAGRRRGSSPRCRCASPTTSTAPASGRPRCSPSTASCRATGRCSTARARPGRPTSPSSAPPTRSPSGSRALGRHRRHRLRRRRVRRQPRRGRGDPSGAGRYAHRLMRRRRRRARRRGRWRRRCRAPPARACAPSEAAQPRPAPTTTTGRRRRRRSSGRRAPTSTAELTMEWECASVDTSARPRRSRRRARSPSPSAARSSTTATTARPARHRPRRPGRVRHRARLVPRRPPAGRAARPLLPGRLGPSGVGRSLPAIDCGDVDSTGLPDAETCIERTGAAARPRSARPTGTRSRSRSASPSGSTASTTSATATARRSARSTRWPIPDGVGRFVLDGAIDPTAGDPDGPLAADGVPDYAADEIDDVIARFHELCDASTECAAGPDSRALVDDLGGDHPRPARRPSFPGEPAQMNRIDLEDLMIGVTYDPWSWGLVGDALRDGADGDASTLAALSSYLLDGYPVAAARRGADERLRRRPLRHLLRRLQPRRRALGAATACRTPIRCR